MILLDTCTLIWLVSDQTFLSVEAKKSLQENKGSIYVSGITAFEIGRLAKKEKISISSPTHQWYYTALQEHHIQEITLTSNLMFLAEELPDIHQDPADRFIIASALSYSFSILTPDQTIAKYPHVKTIW